MNLRELERLGAEFLEATPMNAPEVDGRATRLFDAPLFGCAAADDPAFAELLRPEAIGGHFRLPGRWLRGARSVLSFFLPFSEEVRCANRAARCAPSAPWLYGRVEGQALVAALCEHLCAALAREGYGAVSPSLSGDFWSVSEPEEAGGAAFTSNWSERHVAYVCGLGTFGLSKGLITSRGMAGRFGSLVTDCALEPTPRTYRDIYERCIRCGACARRCPGGAISLEGGKDHLRCYRYQQTIREQCLPRYGCGLCQTGVPCEHGIPAAKRAAEP